MPYFYLPLANIITELTAALIVTPICWVILLFVSRLQLIH